MATVKLPKGKTAAKAGKAPAKATKATNAKAKAPAANKAGNGRRTAEDIDKLVPQFVKHLKAGGTMRQLKQDHGFSDDGPIRQALARKGYNPKGEALELPNVAATTKGVKAAREQGHAWYTIALATGKTEKEVKALAEKAGVQTAGRVYVGGGRGR